MSFDQQSRWEIRDRAGNKSELTDISDRPLQACHLSHSRQLEEYNQPDMGVLVTDIEHLAYHLIFRYNSFEIGLNRDCNERAIDSLYTQIRKFNKRNGIKMSEEDLFGEIEKARDYWFFYLGIEEQ